MFRYRVVDGIQLPFKVSPIVKEHGRSRLEVNIKLKAQVRQYATNVHVLIHMFRSCCPPLPNPFHSSTSFFSAV